MKKIKNWPNCLDQWLCINIPFHRLRIFWQKLWIRENEFHVSLNIDTDAVFALESRGAKSARDIFFGFGLVTKRTAQYLAGLSRRRETAHRRTL